MHEYVLPFGPQHPALLEPLHIRLKVDGETVVSSDITLGYNHKGIEKSFENRWWSKGMYLSERVCGICGHFHTSNFAQGIENLLKLKIPDRANYMRVLISELERIHSHLLALGVVAYEIGMDTLFHYIFRDRELVMNLQELLTGNRVHFAMNVIGGVRRDINLEQTRKVEENLEEIEQRCHHYIDLFKNDASIKRRMKHTGFLSKKKAKELNPVGPNVRASGVDYDVRDSGYFAYNDLNFRMVTGEGGDVLERCLVRFRECIESTKLVQECLLKLPKGPLKINVPHVIKIKEGLETVSRVEAPRGELIYYIKSAGDKPYRVKIRTPTYQTFHILGEILKGYEIPDVPAIIASIDPCISCADRMTIVDTKTKRERIVTKEEIRKGVKEE